MPGCRQAAARGHVRVNSAQLSSQTQGFRDTSDDVNQCTFTLVCWNPGDIPRPKPKQTGSNINPARLYIPRRPTMQLRIRRRSVGRSDPASHNEGKHPIRMFWHAERFPGGQQQRQSETSRLTTTWVYLYSFIFEFCRNCRPIVNFVNMK